MAKYLTSDNDMTAVADAIRAKGGTSGNLTFPSGFVSAVGNIPVGVDQETLDAALATKADKTTEVTVATDGAVTQALEAGKIYHFTGDLTALTITLTAPASGDLAHYHFDFSTGSTAPTVTIPSAVTMPSGFSVDANKVYEIDILNGRGVYQSWGLS